VIDRGSMHLSVCVCMRGSVSPAVYRVGQTSKLLILSEYVNKTERIGGM